MRIKNIILTVLSVLLLTPLIAYTATSPLPIFQGGTSTTTAPTNGVLLVGNSSGTWDYIATSSLGIEASPGGANTQVQFNDNGSSAGDSDFVWDKTANLLTLTGDLIATNATTTILNVTTSKLGTVISGTWNGTVIDISDYTNLVAGTNITLSGDTLNVDDVFLPDTGGTGTGSYDFGGTDSFEITNSAEPTVNTTGEIAVDTTSGQFSYYDGTAERALYGDFDKSLWIASSTIDKDYNEFSSGTSTFEIWNPNRAVTISESYCKTDTGTVQCQFGDGTNWTDLMTCSSSGVEDTSLSNNTFTAREDVQVRCGGGASTPNKVTITGTFIYTLD